MQAWGHKTLEQLDKMTDQRLLAYYKAIRVPQWNYNSWYENDTEEFIEAQEAYIAKVKMVLEDRGHVKTRGRKDPHVNDNTKDPKLK